MKRQDFYFELPDKLIAQFPLANRSDSRLLVYDRSRGIPWHASFKAILDILEAGDLLVMNDTKVILARLYGHKDSGGKVQLLVERLTGDQTCLAHIKASKTPKPGTRIELQQGFWATVIEKEGDLYHCQLSGPVEEVLEQCGHMPLPPYITREDTSFDLDRYQTIYAKHKGSVAAPTAGLHWDEAMLQALKQKGVQLAYLTLHVGAGTFQPVRVDSLDDHHMHAESFNVSSALCEQIKATKAQGKRVIAVGTTSLRALESVASKGDLVPTSGQTDIFIYPGYRFRVCDGLVTNFHLPESTLLMLVAAFIGHQEVMDLYKTAVAEEYRFFSYGDACLFL